MCADEDNVPVIIYVEDGETYEMWCLLEKCLSGLCEEITKFTQVVVLFKIHVILLFVL